MESFVPKTPAAAAAADRLSGAALAIARILILESINGEFGDPQLSVAELRTRTGLTDDEIVDGVAELEQHGLLSTDGAFSFDSIGFDHVLAKPDLFAEFDVLEKPWNPRTDALQVARELMTGPEEGFYMGVLAARIGWEPRRLNPAITYLVRHELAEDEDGATGGLPWVTLGLRATRATRRFAQSGAA
jgi:hypothetical protein